jgi:hypothetical protein
MRELMGWEHYDTAQAVAALNDLCRSDLSVSRWMDEPFSALREAEEEAAGRIAPAPPIRRRPELLWLRAGS